MKEKRIKRSILGLVVIITNLLILFGMTFNIGGELKVSYDVKADEEGIYQLFYTYDTDFGQYVENDEYKYPNESAELTYSIPKEVTRIRLDMGEKPANIEVSNIHLSYYSKALNITELVDLDKGSMNDVEIISISDNNLQIVSTGKDPYITINLNDIQNSIINVIETYLSWGYKIIICILFNGIAMLSFKKRMIIRQLCTEVYKSRTLLINLSKNDFKTRYAGSYLGITWAFVQPIVVVLIYWFVFQVGFKSAPMDEFPFLLWLIAGIIPWFFFNEALLSATNSLIEYSYLVKKVVFKISVLPAVKIISAFYVHAFFIVFANIVYLLYGYTPSIHMVQVGYYSICTFVLVLALAYMTSAVVIFFRDLGQIVSILLQFGMWMTPIMWSQDMMPHKLQWILKLNPMYYIVEGYRDTFIRHVWFWERYNQTMYFWLTTGVLFMLGIYIFKKLKPHFSDVL